MNKIPLTLLLIVGLCPASRLFAQEETNAEEVDRILAEIETDPVTETAEEASDESAEVVSEASTDGAESMEEAEDVFSDDPSEVPAINLEEAVDVDVELRGGDDINSEFVTVAYTDVKLADVVKILAQTAGANIIIPDGMEALVSANLNDVHWREALEVILADKGYILVERSSGIFTITTRDKMATEPLSSETIDLQYITSEAALPVVQSLLMSSNASVNALLGTSVLVVSETPERIQQIKGMLNRVDRPRRQVFIEAKFVELNDSAIQDLGINWQVLQGYTVRATGLSSEIERIETRSTQDAQALFTSRLDSSVRTADSSIPDSDTRTTLGTQSQLDTLIQGRNFEDVSSSDGDVSFQGIPTLQQTVTKKAVLSADDFALTLSALQQLDGTRIVSNPKMLVANGQTATIHVGRNEPNIRAVPQGENASTFAYVLDGFIEIGVKLEVTPTISTDKNITINIIPELSRLIGEKEVGEAGTSFPITQIRKIQTEFAVESGKTVAIGGLTQTEDQEDVTKIPLLGDLPIIGKYLFTHTSTRKVQDEIIIFVTVDAMETDDMNDRDGIPQHGSLIHTWLDHQNTVDDINQLSDEEKAALLEIQ